MRQGRFSGRLHVRSLVVTLLLLAAALGVAWWSLITGSASVTAEDVIAALSGSADAGTTRIVMEWRLPRVLFAILAGAALAIAGGIFQSLTRNPLGSPDIIGFSTGAYTGALIAGSLGLSGIVGTPVAALVGGLGTGIVVYLLAWKRGASGLRIIVVGIGVSLFLGAINTYLLTLMRVEEAMSAASWGAGSLNDIAWRHVVPVGIVLAVTVPLVLSRERNMAFIEMGDDVAHALGIAVERVRVSMLVLAILLVAVVTAAAGPIAFVALAAPQLAMRLCGTSGIRLLPSAAMGSLLLVGADLLARTAVAPAQLPVGIVTLCLGGAYLVGLLIALGRSGRRRG